MSVTAPVLASIEALRLYATDLVEASRDAAAPVPPTGHLDPLPRRASLRRRAVVALAAASLFASANAGLAIAADGAAPGDLLYAADRG